VWDDELEPVLLASLQMAYLRRKRWEARLQAIEVVRALGQGLTPEDGDLRGTLSGTRHRVVSSEQLMITMGAKWH